MRTPPGSALSHQSVEDDQQLPHTRNQRHHLLGLSGLNESLVEFLDGGLAARSDQGSHVERASLRLALPPHTVRRPLKVRESSLRGATPTRAESSLGEREPSSGSSARSVLQSTRPTPGTLLKRASFSLRVGLFSMVSSRSRSVRESSFSSHLMWASMRPQTALEVLAPRRFFSAVIIWMICLLLARIS